MNHMDTVWPYWNLMDFTPEGRPDQRDAAAEVQVGVPGEALPESGLAQDRCRSMTRAISPAIDSMVALSRPSIITRASGSVPL